MTEEWKPIANHQGFEISSKGNVRSFWTEGVIGTESHTIESYGKAGIHNIVVIRRHDGEPSPQFISQLMIDAFIGQKENFTSTTQGTSKLALAHASQRHTKLTPAQVEH